MKQTEQIVLIPFPFTDFSQRIRQRLAAWIAEDGQ